MIEDTRKRVILWVICSAGIILTGGGSFLIGLSRGAEVVMIKYTGLMFGGYNVIVGLVMIALSFYTLFKINEEELKKRCDVVEMH